MPKTRMPTKEFVELYNKLGPREFANRCDLSLRGIFARAARYRQKGYDLRGPHGASQHGTSTIPAVKASPRAEVSIETGFGLVASDAHYWPGEETLMHRAFLWACREFAPKFVVLNGDVMDFPAISRHAPIGWESRPSVVDEIEWAQEKCHEIAMACKRGTRKIWTLGNHDKRFETRLATQNPEYAKINGVHLKDHFPAWEPAWSAYVNPQQDLYSCLITHRFRGGIHDTHNNMLWTGNHIVTGHTHNAQVRAMTYYNERTIWGVNSGMLGEPSARAFVDYTEDSPKNWRSAFVILRWIEGKLLQPQLVLKFDEKRVQLGGELITP